MIISKMPVSLLLLAGIVLLTGCCATHAPIGRTDSAIYVPNRADDVNPNYKIRIDSHYLLTAARAVKVQHAERELQFSIEEDANQTTSANVDTQQE